MSYFFAFGLFLSMSVLTSLLIRFNMERNNGWMFTLNIISLILNSSCALYFGTKAVMEVIK